ncbi:biopolymer transport protein ExbB [Desulfobaculum xiamenense]|uniref:Biopolymer transport protein ExbB n=1 Tax=Desulfobaculum xiamenense TaxID=995050 RepID=A0A846QNE6_9BACT|nr:MotA/TolQ/ExbB proton channel family protein [Desulfobaculum xiamenense]NJB68540.1 biopolymer transport protein ExbB [Desulfobaculum xiamenense]
MTRNMIVLFVVLAAMAAFAATGRGAETGWPEAARGVEANLATARADAAETRRAMEQERDALIAEHRAAKDSTAALEREVRDLEREFNALLEREQGLRTELADQQEEMKALEGTIRTAAKEADTLSRQNPITAEHPDRDDVVRALLDTKRFPGMDDVRALTGIFFDEITATGELARREGDFTGPDGSPAHGSILRIGRFATCYSLPDGRAGYLLPDAAGTGLTAVTGGADADAADDAADFMAAKATLLPVDLSGGAVFARIADEKDLLGWLASGGLLIWPILLVGVAALALIVERIAALWRVHSATGDELRDIQSLATAKDWNACRERCAANTRSPACRVIGSMLESIGTTREILEDTMQEAILRELPRLERFLPTLSVLAAIAPLLGLLGTVTGMINTFQAITLFGAGNPRMMSGGISEALITTQVGLAVAIPIMVAHHALERRVDAIIGDMEEKGASLAIELARNGAVGTENGHA